MGRKNWSPKSREAYRSSMIAKHGSLEAWKAFQKVIGARGGAKSVGGGFTGRPDLARIAGMYGGRKKAKNLSESEQAWLKKRFEENYARLQRVHELAMAERKANKV